MDIENIPDDIFYTEYERRKSERKSNQEAKEKQEERQRIRWLESNGGTCGNDQCATSYCRINCYGCDGF
jgi:hypothetical protein